MGFLTQVFNWMIVIGVGLLIGRVLTLIFMLFDIPFTTFFKDYSIISFIILIVGLIGSHSMKDYNRRK